MDDLSAIKGQLLATQAAIRALILNSADVNQASLAVQREIERVFSSALSKALPDAYVEGLQAAKERILPSAGDLERLRNQGQ